MPLDPINSESQNNGQNADNQRLLAGKYANEQELEQGYLHQFNETQKIIAANRELEQRLNAVMPLIQQGITPGRANPNERRTSAFELALSGERVDPEDFRRELREEVALAMRPVVQSLGAKQQVLAEIPDFSKFEGEVAQFVAANPTIGSEMQLMAEAGAPAAALKYAFREYMARKGSTSAANAEMQTRLDATGAQQAQARMDAAIMGGGNANRSESAVSGSVSQIAELRKIGMDTGNWDPYMNAVMNAVIPDEHIGIPAQR